MERPSRGHPNARTRQGGRDPTRNNDASPVGANSQRRALLTIAHVQNGTTESWTPERAHMSGRAPHPRSCRSSPERRFDVERRFDPERRFDVERPGRERTKRRSRMKRTPTASRECVSRGHGQSFPRLACRTAVGARTSRSYCREAPFGLETPFDAPRGQKKCEDAAAPNTKATRMSGWPCMAAC